MTWWGIFSDNKIIKFFVSWDIPFIIHFLLSSSFLSATNLTRLRHRKWFTSKHHRKIFFSPLNDLENWENCVCFVSMVNLYEKFMRRSQQVFASLSRIYLRIQIVFMMLCVMLWIWMKFLNVLIGVGGFTGCFKWGVSTSNVLCSGIKDVEYLEKRLINYLFNEQAVKLFFLRKKT